MKPTITYDAAAKVGRIQFANHVTVVHGSREFCERFVEGLQREADDAYQLAMRAGRRASDAARARDRVLCEGLVSR